MAQTHEVAAAWCEAARLLRLKEEAERLYLEAYRKADELSKRFDLERNASVGLPAVPVK